MAATRLRNVDLTGISRTKGSWLNFIANQVSFCSSTMDSLENSTSITPSPLCDSNREGYNFPSTKINDKKPQIVTARGIEVSHFKEGGPARRIRFVGTGAKPKEKPQPRNRASTRRCRSMPTKASVCWREGFSQHPACAIEAARPVGLVHVFDAHVRARPG